MATRAPTTPATITRHDSPARMTIARPVMAISMAVPRSGWWATSSTGAPIIAAGTSSRQDSRALSDDRP